MGGIARIGQIQLLQPFVALAAAALLLGETVGWLEIGFAVLVVGHRGARLAHAGGAADLSDRRRAAPQFRARIGNDRHARSSSAGTNGETTHGEDRCAAAAGLLALALASGPASAQTAEDAFGVWLNPENGSNVEFYKCGGEACAARSPRSPTGRRPTTRTPTPPSATGRSSASSSWRAPRRPATTSGPATLYNPRGRQELLRHRHRQEQGRPRPVGLRGRRAVQHRDLDAREVAACPRFTRRRAMPGGACPGQPRLHGRQFCCAAAGQCRSRQRCCTARR